MSKRLYPGLMLQAKLSYFAGLPGKSIPIDTILTVISDIIFDDNCNATITLLSSAGDLIVWKRVDRVDLENSVLYVHEVLK